MIGRAEGRVAEPQVTAGDHPDAGQERMRLLAGAVAPRVASLAGTIFDRTGPDEPHVLRRIIRCLCIGLSACTQVRNPNDAERRELHEIGRTLARSGGTPPALVGMHSVLLLGHSEALRTCHEFTLSEDFTGRLKEGSTLLLQLSEEMTACIEKGYTDEYDAQNHQDEMNRPIDALCTLITEQTNALWRPYLTGFVRDAGLDKMFPAIMALTHGALRERARATTVHIGRSVRVITATLPEPEPHTLMLCPAESAGPFLSWLQRNATGPTVHTRAVAFDEAPMRYRTTRDVLPFSVPPGESKRVHSARALLWQRMLASQHPEYLRDYAEEVIGPVLHLARDQRDPLLETLDALDRQGGSVRGAAAALNVHEKTIRYRVSRIETLTGLNALARTHWPQLHRAVQLQAMFPVEPAEV